MKKLAALLLSISMVLNQYGYFTFAEETNDEEITENTNEVETVKEAQEEKKTEVTELPDKDEEAANTETADDSFDNLNEKTQETTPSPIQENDSSDSNLEDNEFTVIEEISIPLLSSCNLTRDEAVTWITARKNEGWAEDYDNISGPQCVDLIKYYFVTLVGYFLYGNAYTYVNRDDLPDGWSYSSNPQPGDIAVWDANHGFAGEFGHVALVESVGDGTFDYVDVNGNTGIGGSGTISNSNASTFIRPDFANSPTPITIPDYVYEVNSDGSITITGCNLTSAAEITIPSSIDGKTVKVLGFNSFEKCTELTHVIIPDSVIEIGISTPNVYYQGGNGGPFHNLEKLDKVEMSNNVTLIASNAFYGCSNLNSINIPRSLQKIEASAFKGCTSLKTAGPVGSDTNIVIDFTDTMPSWGDPVSYVYSHCLFENLQFINLPEGIKTIADNAFIDAENLREIRIPDGVTSIGKYAFLYCKNLNKVVIPSSVTSIGESAFLGFGALSLSKLTSVGPIDSGASIEIGFTDTISNIYSQSMLFANVTVFNIPYTVKKLGDDSFRSCTSLTELEIPDSVTEIGERAFQNTNLTSITIPGSVKTIGKEAFQYSTTLKTVVLSEGVQSIGDNAFSSTVFESITIPNTVKNIGESAFAGSKIESIELPDSVESIGGNAFGNCEELESVKLSNNITTISDSLFYGCINVNFAKYVTN